MARETMPLSAGILSLDFEPETAWVRQVSSGHEELVRAIYGAVRMPDWSTPAPIVTHKVERLEENSFDISWEAVYPDLHFAWEGRLIGGPPGFLEYTIRGRCKRPFATSRAGLCLLHPREHAGRAATSASPRVGATREKLKSSFPALVNPYHPFTEIEELRIERPGDEWLELSFFGDTFETEDQRNFGDASFKTYCRPEARLPVPYEILPDTVLRRRVFICVSEREAKPVSHAPVLTLGGSSGVTARLFEWKGPSGFGARLEPTGEAHDPTVWSWASQGFVQANRQRPNPATAGLAFACHPQVHFGDDRTVMENCQALEDLAISARTMMRGKPVAVAPLSFSREADPREKQPIGLAWGVACWLAACRGGAESVHVERPHPDLRRFVDGLPGTAGITIYSQTPSHVQAHAFQAEDGLEAVFVNLTPRPRAAQLAGRVFNLDGYEVRREKVDRRS